MAHPRQFRVEGFPLVLLQFLDESVLHLVQETAVELIPLRRFEIALLQNRCLAEHVDLAADVKVPAVNDLTVVLLLPGVYLLHVVFCIFDDDLVRLAIKPEDNRNLIALSVLNPPRLEA